MAGCDMDVRVDDDDGGDDEARWPRVPCRPTR